jgi:hypothetical protein
MTSRIPMFARAFVALTLTVPALDAQQPAEFIVRKGKDTVAIERFSRDAATLTGQISQSNGLKTEYVVNLRPDHSAEHIEMSRQGRTGPAALMSIDFADTVARISATAGKESMKMDLLTAARPAPFLVASFALSEQLVRASAVGVGQSRKWTAVRLAAGDTVTVIVSRPHADSVTLSMPEADVKLFVSRAGDILGASYPALQWVVERKHR